MRMNEREDAMSKAIEYTGEEKSARRGWLKIGEVAKRSGVGIEALRFYERQGLLGQPARTDSGYRMYDSTVLERLEFIKQAQVLGFSLTEISRIIAEKDAGQSPCAEVREIVRLRLEEIDQRLKEMKRYRRELAAALRDWDETGDVDGHVCGLIEGVKMKTARPKQRQLKRGKK